MNVNILVDISSLSPPLVLSPPQQQINYSLSPVISVSPVSSLSPRRSQPTLPRINSPRSSLPFNNASLIPSPSSSPKPPHSTSQKNNSLSPPTAPFSPKASRPFSPLQFSSTHPTSPPQQGDKSNVPKMPLSPNVSQDKKLFLQSPSTIDLLQSPQHKAIPQPYPGALNSLPILSPPSPILSQHLPTLGPPSPSLTQISEASVPEKIIESPKIILPPQIKGAPPPPPPMSKKKALPAAKPTMKRLNWTKLLAQQIPGTVFDDLYL